MKPQALQIADDLDKKQRLAYSRRDVNDPCSPEAALIRQQHAAIVALSEALADAQLALHGAWQMFSAICETDNTRDRRGARDRAYAASCKARADLAEHGAKQ